MNLENLDVLSRKIEALLDSLRRLKGEKAEVEKNLEAKNAEVESLKATVAAKDSEIEQLRSNASADESKLAEMEKLVKDQDAEIQSAREKFQNLLTTIENELGTEIPVQESAEEPKVQESAQSDFFA